MELITNICLDVSLQSDRELIIKKYLLPYLKSDPSKFLQIDDRLIRDVFNTLDIEDVDIFYPQIKEIIGEFEKEKFVLTYWRVGRCFDCKKLKEEVSKCKNEHDEDCPYLDDEDGCGKLFCYDCLNFCNVDDELAGCQARRCNNCIIKY